MSFNSLGAYSASHKVWDHVGNVIPDPFVCESEHPWFPFKPAAWLPVQFKDKKFEDWFVVLPGKLVALDPDGRVMPAQYGLTGASVVYTQNDVDAGVLDIRTGEALTATATIALNTIDGSSLHFMGRQGISFADATAKLAIGVAQYPYCQWAGDASALDDGSNPVAFLKHNYIQQHQVAITTDWIIKVPYVPAKASAETTAGSVAGTAIVMGTKALKNRTGIQATARYDASTGLLPCLSTYPVMACVCDNYPVAKSTQRTLITSSVSTWLVNEVSGLSAITAAGDFFVDYEAGVIFFYSADGATLPTGVVAGVATVTYYHYATAAGTVSKFACALGALVPGDLLKADTNSNWVVATDGTDHHAVMGQVLGFIEESNSGLDYVRTAYSPAIASDASGGMSLGSASSASTNAGQLDMMPGSATGGVSDLVHFAGAANKLVVINVFGR